MARSKADPEVRKQQILSAAAAVFTDKGFDKATMDDLVQESGLSKGTLYWHYRNKDDILLSVMEHYLAQKMGILEESLAYQATAGKRLEALIRRAMVEVARISEDLPLSLEFHAIAAREENARLLLREYLRNCLALLTSLIEQGIVSGEFRKVAASEVAISIMAMIEGLILLHCIDPESVDCKRQGDGAVRMLLTELTARDEITPQ